MVKKNKFKIVIPSYNNKRWVDQNLSSILAQTYTNYDVLYINDASTDNTPSLVQKFISEHNLTNWALINWENNKQRGFNVNPNSAHIIDFIDSDEDILMFVDGDDWLFDDGVLEKLNNFYNEKDVWMAYGGMYCSLKKTPAFPQNTPYTLEVHDNKLYRQDVWRASHLRSFRWFLYKRIKKEDLIWSKTGEYYYNAEDLAVSFYCLEMCPVSKIGVLDFPSYIYNEDPEVLQRGQHRQQKDIENPEGQEAEVRAKKPYTTINEADARYFHKSIDKKAVYITGCLGFMGSYIVRVCLDLGWYVKGVDKITYAANTHLLKEFKEHSNFSFIHCDINDLEFLYDCDYVINTAAETHVGNSIVKSDDFLESNVKGVHHLLELIRTHRGEHTTKPILLHFSTDEVYGDISAGQHLESDPLCPSNPYAATKAAADQLVVAWGRTYKVPYIILRPTNNYGIGQYVEKLIPKAVKYLSLGRKIPLHDNGLPVRNWLHAADTAQGVIAVIKGGELGQIYNICGGFEQSNLKTVEKVCRELEIPVEDAIDLSYSRDGQDVRYALNDDKLRSLGWSPTHNFDKEIKSIVNYYKKRFIW